MSSENPNELRSEIHSTSDTGILTEGTLESRVTALSSVYSIGDSQNFHMFSHIIQELNRKLDQFGLTRQIIQPIDAGFRPLSVESFFAEKLLRKFRGASVAYSLRDLYGNLGNVVRVRRHDNEENDFTAAQIDSGEMLSWVKAAAETESDAHGWVVTWYDQSGNGYDAREPVKNYQPLIVENGSVVTDNDGKVAIKGTGAKLRLGNLYGESPREMLSADGAHSLFIVCDLPNQTAGNRDYNFISRFKSTSTSPRNRRPLVYLRKSTGELVSVTESSASKATVGSSVAQSAQLVTSIVNPLGATKAEKHSVYIDGTFNAEQPYGTTWVSDGNRTLSTESRLFGLNETTVDTYISELIYYPSDQSANRAGIEANILNYYNI